MIVLSVAEKPSVASSISHILSSSCNKTRGMHKYCPNIQFQTELASESVQMIFTSVLGHLFESSFPDRGSWSETDPKDLFMADIVRDINPEHRMVAENIRRNAEKASLVIVWTDCDREGENIARQIKTVVEEHRRITVKRARFSAISRSEIEYALANLTEINFMEADAVDARIELDLRIGSAFTRIQTLFYDQKRVISFGPCQIPTLNFVVQRHLQIENFVSEKFFTLQNVVVRAKEKGRELNNVFTWERGKVFDKNCVIHFFSALKNGRATITDKKTSQKEKYRPLPLRTVEFQKTCSSYYKLGSHKLMEIAEKLYNKGYISYPRTETDAFSKNFGFKNIINKLKNDERFGEYASDFEFVYPRAGSNNDQAHSPIYPLKDGSSLTGDERKVFEFVARRFLGCISGNAKGVETEYTMEISSTCDPTHTETFSCKGLNITERNYLDVYIYDKWESTEIGEFRPGEVVENNVEIIEGATTKPEYLTESDLISLMDKNGIGTDATIHDHIQKIQTRGYVRKEKFKFVPEKLGINLIKAYNTIGLPISEPALRKDLECNLKRVCEGEKNKDELVASEIQGYLKIYEKLEQHINVYTEIMKDSGGGDPRPSEGGHRPLGDDDARPAGGSGGFRSVGGSGGFRSGGDNSYRPPRDNDSRPPRDDSSRSLRDDNSSRPRRESGPAKKAKRAEKQPPARAKENTSNQIKPTCDCGKEAKLLETKKGENKGRMFYTCFHFPKKCSFFSWEDAPVPEKGRSRPQEPETVVNCFCDYEAQTKIANTDSNRGREFFCCKKSYKKCNFFKWADDL